MRKIIPGKLVAPLAGARPAALVLLAAIVWLHALNPAPVDILRTRVFDLYQNIRPRPPLEQSPVAIADIDEKSLEVYGQWPWPRTLIARVVQAMKDAGALVIGFDVVFAEGDRTSPEYASRFMAGLDELTFEKLQALPRNDVILARRLREVKAVLGQPVTGHARAAGNDRPRKTSVNTIGDVVDFIPHSPGLVRNVEELEAAAAGLGLFSLLPERDGIIRRVPAVMRVADTIYPTLSLELMRVALGRTSIDIRARPEVGIDAVRIADFVIPTDRLGRLWVYFAPRDTLRTYSVHDILSGKIAPEELKNRIVVLGTSAAGLLDVQATPLDGAVPGVEVHVQILDMILSGNHLHRPGWARSAETLVTLLAGLLLVLSGFFSGSETALTASSRGKLRAQADKGSRGAQKALDITDDNERLIGSVLLGNNLVNILAASLATALFTRIFGESGVALATLVMTLLGGMFSFFGPAIGAATLFVLERLTNEYTEYWPTVLGAILLAILLFLPDGLAGLARKFRVRFGEGR